MEHHGTPTCSGNFDITIDGIICITHPPMEHVKGRDDMLVETLQT